MHESLDDIAEFAVHFVMATIPQGQEKSFDASIRKDFYEEYRWDKKKYSKQGSINDKYWYHGDDRTTPVLYNPLRYFLLGNYDITYISLIDSFKFAHRLFEPQLRAASIPDSPEIYNPHTFQSFTGISHEKGQYLKEFFFSHLKKENPTKKYFLGICNLKLNNGLLIGNGLEYIQKAKNLICSKITEVNSNRDEKEKIEYLIVQSFSWFEISLLLFTDSPADISDIIVVLRRSQIIELPGSETIIANSLYNSVLEGEEKENIKNANVFADTHTYIGLHADLITSTNTNDPYIVEFLRKKIELHTEIEWQIKPGHMHLLAHVLEKNHELKGVFDLSSRYMVTGKSDYLLKETNKSIENNFHLLRYIISHQCELFLHVRKIRTKVLFDASKLSELPDRSVINLSDKLKKLAIKRTVIASVDKNLKALKVSRQIRIKILKIFANFNNGIQDIILFPYFLDFKIFVTNLIKLVESARNKLISNKDTGNNLSVHSFEKVLSKWLEVFQEGYSIRLLNGYQFEDIIDFDLDFNSSIQQLLTAYGTISYQIGNLIYKKTNEDNSEQNAEFYPIVQLNYKDTVANYLSINYAVHHLTSPEFFYATLSKEIFNSLKSDYGRFKKFIELYREKAPEISRSINRKSFDDMVASKLIDPIYYFNDAIRFIATYNMDFDLYYYWFWNYNFQNSSLYDQSGLLNENHFRKELFRILFVKKIFNYDIKIDCPLPELYTYWDRHFVTLEELADSYLIQLEAHGLLAMFFSYFSEIIDSTLVHSNIHGTDEVINNIDFLNKLQKIKAYGNMYSVSEFPKRLLRKFYIFQELSDQSLKSDLKAESIVSEDSLIYLQWRMFSYLQKIFEMNNKKVSILRRDWSDGSPLASFVHANKEKHLYSVDQTGGLFFDDMNALNSYFKISSLNILFILNYSLVHKRDFISEKLNAEK